MDGTGRGAESGRVPRSVSRKCAAIVLVGVSVVRRTYSVLCDASYRDPSQPGVLMFSFYSLIYYSILVRGLGGLM